MDFMIRTLPPKSPKIFARRFLAQIGNWEGETSVLLGEDLGYATWGISICPTHQKNDIAFFSAINADPCSIFVLAVFHCNWTHFQ